MSEPETGVTMAGQLAALFRARPNVWLDGVRDLAPVGGIYAWRSRLTDLRRPPFTMQIRNRQRRVRAMDGRRITISEYRFEPQP